MKIRQWLSVIMAMGPAGGMLAQAPALSRPGITVISEITGAVTMTSGEQPKPVKLEERVRAGATVATGRRSMALLALSNGATVELGAGSELILEDFDQSPFSGTIKAAEMKEEPSVSKTEIRLTRGDLRVNVKPLKTARGSSFTITTVAGTVRLGEGALRLGLNLSDLGLGVFTLEQERGTSEFSPVGADPMPVQTGQKLSFVVETERGTGNVKVSPMPKEIAGGPARKK